MVLSLMKTYSPNLIGYRFWAVWIWGG
jgi:hypothetical protein